MDALNENISLTLYDRKADRDKAVLEDLRLMWHECFGDPYSFEEFYHDEICRQNKIICAYLGTKLVGMAHLNPYNVWLNGIVINCYYIVGVAVKADMRRTGIMKRMLYMAFDLMRSEGCPMTFLMPARDEYYTGFGFTRIYRTSIIELSVTQMTVQKDIVLRDISAYGDYELSLLAERINCGLDSVCRYHCLRDTAYLKKMIAEHICQNGGVMLYLSDRTACIFSFDRYDSHMYVDRLEPLCVYGKAEAEDIIEAVRMKAVMLGCSECTVTMPETLALKLGDEYVFKPSNGIMALALQTTEIDINDMKKASFFDEIV